MRKQIVLLSLGLCAIASTAEAGVGSKIVQETVEFTTRKFGKEVAEEGFETMAGKMTRLASKHGDDVVAGAFTKVGPRAGKIASEAGEHGGVALRVLAKHGDNGIALTLSKTSLGTVARYGDDAATALIRHGSVGQKLIQGFGKEGVEALARVTPQSGRRLAMLAADGTLKPELMTVVARYGDEACEFIWRNKGALTVGTALTAFVTAPEEFLEGTRGLAEVAGDAAIKPLASVPGAVANEAAKRVNWNLVTVIVAVVVGIFVSRWAGFFGNVARAAEWWSKKRSATKEVGHDA